MLEALAVNTIEEAPCEIESSRAVDLSGHVPVLDGIRGFAVLLVTAYRFNIGPADTQLPGKILFHALRHGELGVELFLVLSGFLITGKLFDAKGTDHYFRNFYIRRALRIFPLYYGFLALTLLILPAMFGEQLNIFPPGINQAWVWLYGSNFLMGIRDNWCLGSFTHTWSLSVEEHFYLVWPLVVFFLSRRQALWFGVGAILFSFLGRIVWVFAGGPGVAIDTFTFFRLDGIALGAFMALAARGPRGIAPLVRPAQVVGLISGILMLGISALPNGRLLGASMLVESLFFGSLLILAVAADPARLWAKFWGSSVLGFFGKYSYAMYLFQLPLIVYLAPLVTPEGLCEKFGSVLLGRLAYILVMSTITTLLAIASWNLYEKHFLALKGRLTHD